LQLNPPETQLPGLRQFGRYERLSQPLLQWPGFVRRLTANVLLGLLLLMIALFIGMAGYHWLVRLIWIDAYENAAMILSGMGPIATPQSWGGKFFAGTYALVSGIIVLATTGIVFAPILHRFLHYLHADPSRRQ
jgi:hypothetical protein